MAQKSRADLLIQANVIKNETVANRNTQVRVGTMNIDEIDSSININDTEPNTWYINTNGDNSKVGSDKFPFETIQKAHDAASANDTILIQNIDFSESGNFNISKTLLIKGPAGYNESETAKITGQFTITNGANLILENLNVEGITIVSSAGDTKISIRKSLLRLVAATDSAVDLSLRETKLQLFSGIKLRTLTMNDSDGGGSDLEVSREAELLNGSFFSGNLDVGLDVAASLNLRNSTIEGNISTTLNLSKFNSVITGTETVSGTTTSRQAKVFDDNTVFKKQVRGGSSTVAFSATKTFSMDNGNFQKMPVTAAITSLAISDDLNGHAYWIMLEIGGAGSYTIPQAGASFGTRTDNSVDDSVASWFPTTVGSKIMYTIARDPDGEKIYSIETITV